MFTVEHIQTFKHFGGDIDGWARMKKSGDTMTDKIWPEIEGALQNLVLVNKGLAAESFRSQTLERLRSVGTNDEAVEALLNLSKNQLNPTVCR